MYSSLFLCFSSFLFSLLITPFVRNQALKRGLVDQPNDRKLHTTAIPRLGGIAIFLSYILAFAALSLTPLQAGRIITASGLPLALKIAPAILIIFAVGLWDDLRPIRPWQKLVGQIVAASAVYMAGVSVSGFGGYGLPPYLTLPATIFWLVLCANAINLIDGIDGLAAGVGFFATATTLLAALLINSMDLALAIAPLLGALLGFLRYNFNPATIFLGDCGSLFVGFLLGCCSIIWSQKSATMLGMTAPLLALSIPLLDTALAVVRRFLRGKPIFTADRGHIHHRLLDRGLTPRKVALLIYGFCAIAAILSLCMMTTNLEGPAIVLFCVVTWMGVQHLGYVEFGVAGRMFVEGAFRRMLHTNIALKMFEDRLRAANSIDSCWAIIEESAKDFGFHAVSMKFNGYENSYVGEGTLENSWQVRIPISAYDVIELVREFEASSQQSVVAQYADVLRRTLQPKIAEFQSQQSILSTGLSVATSVGK